MLPKTHPLIEAATKPLADNAEQQLAAIALLEDTFIHDHPAAAETLARLHKTSSRRVPALASIFLYLLAATALITAISTQITEFRRISAWYHIPFLKSIDSPRIPSGLSPQQLLLLGDPGLPELRQKELLYASDPENPAYYCEYVTEYVSRYTRLPPGYFETVASIAPENSFFLYYAAGQIGGKSIEKKRSPSGPSYSRFVDGVRLNALPVEREFIILEQADFDEALSLIAKAAELPKFETYGNRMTADRATLFPNDTLAESLDSLSYQFGSPSSVIQIRKATDLLCAQAQVLSHRSGKQEFLTLVEQQKHLVKSFANNPDSSLINELVYSAVAVVTARCFHRSADRLGLEQLGDDYEKQWQALQDDKDQRDIRAKKEEIEKIVLESGSILSNQTIPMVMRQIAQPPPLTDDDLKPLRLVDHDVASRLGIVTAALIIAILCVPVYFFRYHSPRPIRVPGLLFAKLLRPADWAWITLCGIVAPIVINLAINRLTPLGGRDGSIEFYYFFFPGTHLVAILLNLLLAPAILIRWRLSKRLAPFGIKCWAGLDSIAMIFLLLLWSLGAYVFVLISEPIYVTLIGMAAVPFLWLGNVFLNVLLAFIGKPAGRIPRVATTAALLPAYAIAIIALCLTLPLFISSEKHWMKQDTLFRINPNAPNLGAYEYRAAAQKRKEISAMLER